MEDWFNVLKMPYINWREVQADYDSDVKAQGTLSNPLVFIEDPTPLPNEEFGSDYKKYFGGGGYGNKDHKTFTYPDNQEMSSFGRVKIDNKIQTPQLTQYGFGTFLTGNLEHYKQNRYKSKYGGKTKTYRKRGSMIPYKITVQYMLDNNLPIPDNAPVFASGTQIGTYRKWRESQ